MLSLTLVLLPHLLGIVAAQDYACDENSVRDSLPNGDPVAPPVNSLDRLASCSDPPIQDCHFCDLTTPDSATCSAWAPSAGTSDPKGVAWPLYLSYILGCAMAYAIGGNDSANSLATSVGSGAISLGTAVWMGAFGEFIGATFLGAGVSSTIQRGVADINDPTCWACGFCNSMMPQYQTGMIAALFGAAFFLLLVTFWALPVSTTHSVVGGVAGMTMAAVGAGCLNWSFVDGLGRIALGWVVSPLCAGLIGSIMYFVTYHLIMKAEDPKQSAFRSVPALYGLTFGMMTFLTLMKAPLTKGLISDTQNIYISVAVVFISALGAQILVVPGMRIEVAEEEKRLDAEDGQGGGKLIDTLRKRGSETIKKMESVATRESVGLRSFVRSLSGLEQKEPLAGGQVELEHVHVKSQIEGSSQAESNSPEIGSGLVIGTKALPTRAQLLAKRVFKNLVVMTAFIKCVGHGANDTANATGIVGAVDFVYHDGIYACGSRPTDTYIMAIAGAIVGLGVITMGYRVIQTVGSDMVDIDFHVGFCVEFSSACAVVVATILGLPVSTTHCQIGSIVFVAFTAYGNEGVAWGMFAKIGVSWLATLPAAGGVAYALTWAFVGS